MASFPGFPVRVRVENSTSVDFSAREIGTELRLATVADVG
jgi:hypothetical protein